LRLIGWIIAAIVILAVCAFAVTNRALIDIDFWPLPYAATLPLFAVLLGAVIVGFVFGAIVAWWSGRRTRRKARERGWEIESLQRELEMAKRQSRSAAAAAPQVAVTDSGEAPRLEASGGA
jgi:uncharacterized integral membrane protein